LVLRGQPHGFGVEPAVNRALAAWQERIPHQIRRLRASR
jgi:hypothetical protein